MNEYTEKEIRLAKRIYDATMLVSGHMTIRRERNLAKKHGYPPPNELPNEMYLKTAKELLLNSEKELDKSIRDAVENMK